MLVCRHQHVLLAGADFHALIRLHMDAVVLGLQQQLAVMGDMAHVATLGKQSELIACIDHHFPAGGELLVLLRNAVDVLACTHGNTAGRRGSDAGRPT
ncbi:hypothetical protein D3C73_1306140 [compost metagenome]